MKHTVFIGLGSNLADPVAQVSSALLALNGLPQTQVVRCSSLYRSSPLGYVDQPDFINAVAQVESELTARGLLDEMLSLELERGRTREFQNAPRTLDLDILLYEDRVHHEHGLTIPHPQMHQRAFVLQPLLEIAPDCIIPGIGAASDALVRCGVQKLERLQDAPE
jgi:2-amino-4-hydroxy-6-hydroxymethyldihydropteridine diphosphokinase